MRTLQSPMKISSISVQVKDPDRVNVSVDGKYRFSLGIYQVGELGLKIGRELSNEELAGFEQESQFGKLYGRALEYCLMRPHSAKEIKDYLWRKTRATKYKSRTGEIRDREGVSQDIADRVYLRLVDRGYIDDEKFTRFWVENRNQTKGTSRKKLTVELRAKGVDASVIDQALSLTERSEQDELSKVIIKKSSKYSDERKLIEYLMRQGFRYDDIMDALNQQS